MNRYKNLNQDYARQIAKALVHLKYSYNKIQKLSHKIEDMDEETLESWEGFSARFARVSELFLSPYLRTFVLKEDPGFEGTFRDFLNKAEKHGLIENVDVWFKVREIRNKAAQEYNEKSLETFFKILKDLTPTLLSIEESIKNVS